MEMCYDGALVMPKNYAFVSDEEMTYVDGGMHGRTTTAEERICTASFIAASAVALGKLTFEAFKALAATACTGVLAFFGCIGSAALLAGTVYEGTLAAIAAGFAASGTNYDYTYFGFGSFSLYVAVSS